jgi:hypothetical protein
VHREDILEPRGGGRTITRSDEPYPCRKKPSDGNSNGYKSIDRDCSNNNYNNNNYYYNNNNNNNNNSNNTFLP